MKLKLTAILILLSLIVSSQELNCCNTEDEVKSMIEGNWMLKNVEHISNFEYSFLENIAICIIKQEFNIDSENKAVINHKTDLKISKDEIGYILEWNSDIFRWNARIVKLKSRKMVIEINGSQIEFKKIGTKA
ncbi:hypothetical protein J4050_11240 [Winogradskyella sp. DF17]|jgi:hypothetical protein|uniref:Lipocalin-like domain-containing protein n=1 Tax=Winogradskyella pelagia TaxID=2819984 RepID=A0ABS3T6J2_9FLAO|nr:hypothetical protein [Winogradskyella sp. DF17]MBO3117325.1 hypothetical protein [Winogradskyella sp. DF17]